MPALLGKDPLQRELSPYELLELERGAPSADVEPAFRRALLRRAHLSRITAAKLALERPLERELLELFLYDLAPLEPSPLREPEALEPARRAATAAAWETQLRRGFPDLRAAHSLALLWYWWAAADSDPQARGAARLEASGALAAEPEDAPRAQPDAALRAERWRSALCYFAMLAANDEFWAERSATPELARERLLEKLRTELRALPASAGGMRAELEATLESELAAGRALFAAGLRTRHGRISCGPQLLAALGLLEPVRERLDARLRERPGAPGLAELRERLDALAPVRALLEARRPADALAALERPGEDGPEPAGAARLRARAWLELGREQVSVQRLDEALGSWERGLAACDEPALTEALRDEIRRMSRARAAALARRPEAARAVLERALALAPDPSLTPALAEVVHRCGAELALHAQQRLAAEQRATRANAEKLSRALEDLSRAVQLGAGAAAADEALVQQLLDELARAPGALEALRAAIDGGAPGTDRALRPRLAVLLCNRAVEQSQRALACAAQTAPRPQSELALLQKLRQRRAARRAHCVQCDLCGAHGGGQFFPLELPDATSCTLCRGCAGRMRGFTGASGDALARLTAAEQDLREAAALAPGHTVEKNLADVQRLLQALRDDPTAAGAAAARPRWIRAAYLAGVALLLLYFFHDFGGRFAP